MTDPTPDDLVRVVSAAILDPAGRILLCRRHPDPNVPGFSEKWCCPGGKVESGESDIEALRRELREEVSLEDVEVDRRVAYYILRSPGYPRAYSVTTYLVRVTDPAKAVLTHAGGQDMRWVDPFEAGVLIPPGGAIPRLRETLLKGTEVVLTGLGAIGLFTPTLWVRVRHLDPSDFLDKLQAEVTIHLQRFGHLHHLRFSLQALYRSPDGGVPPRRSWVEQRILPDTTYPRLTPDNLGVDRIIFYTSETP